jgi:hypothetical protein
MVTSLKWLLRFIFAGFIVVVIVLGYYYVFYHTDLAMPYRSQGQNALWARHQWVGDQHTQQEYDRFAAHLKHHAITDVFFHVGPLNANGQIESQKYPFAAQLLQQVKKAYPELHLQAWIGQVEAKGGGLLDWSHPEVRANILQTAQTFLDLGFDGIHYDIEPIYSGDPDFLDLLQQTQSITNKQQKILSIASDELEPFWGAGKIARIFTRQAGFWTKPYYTQVAAYVDQIAVMMYDTALPTDWLYGSFVKRVTKNLLQILAPNLTLFMGVPTYEEARWSFHPKAENIRSGIRGIQKGLASFEKSKIQHFGIALYAEWTTDQAEWDIYQQEWAN